MNRHGLNACERLGCLLAGVAALLVPALSAADDAIDPVSRVFGNAGRVAHGLPLAITALQGNPAELAFDLGGSETRKLELQLADPLTLGASNSMQKSALGVGSVFMDTSMSLHLNDSLDITASLGAGKERASFQPLGSIHCQNGVLEQGSYRASDCHFINQANVLKQDQVALGLRYRGPRASSAVSMFRSETKAGNAGVLNYGWPAAGAAMAPGLLNVSPTGALFPAITPGQAVHELGSQTAGLDMEFQVGLTTDSAGEVRLGLQLTRILDASYGSVSDYAAGWQNWKVASPFDSAKVNLDWTIGNFSGGIQGFYREQVQFLNRAALDSSTTFDLHFTWRAPWNANLIIGTSNLLNAGSEDQGKADAASLRDPFEAVYGRIPYVRYQQDL